MLEELTATRDLPYRYDALFRGPAVSAEAGPAEAAPTISTAGGPVCRLLDPAG